MPQVCQNGHWWSTKQSSNAPPKHVPCLCGNLRARSRRRNDPSFVPSRTATWHPWGGWLRRLASDPVSRRQPRPGSRRIYAARSHEARCYRTRLRSPRNPPAFDRAGLDSCIDLRTCPSAGSYPGIRTGSYPGICTGSAARSRTCSRSCTAGLRSDRSIPFGAHGSIGSRSDHQGAGRQEGIRQESCGQEGVTRGCGQAKEEHDQEAAPAELGPNAGLSPGRSLWLPESRARRATNRARLPRSKWRATRPLERSRPSVRGQHPCRRC